MACPYVATVAAKRALDIRAREGVGVNDSFLLGLLCEGVPWLRVDIDAEKRVRLRENEAHAPRGSRRLAGFLERAPRARVRHRSISPCPRV